MTDEDFKYIDELRETIHRQAAEIEKLNIENEILSINADTAFQDGLSEARDLYSEEVKDEIKSEAIKEFAEKLKDIYIKDKRYDRPNAHTLIDWLFANIDNLVKEYEKGR